MDFVWGNKSQSFGVVTGTVANTSKWSETHVSSSGTGNNVSVSSSVTSKHEFWLQTNEGKQVPVQLVNADFPLMQGQVVTMVNAPSQKKPDEERWIYVANHSADQKWYLNAALGQAASGLLPNMRIWSMAVPVVLIAMSGAAAIFPIGAVGYIGYRFFWRWKEQKKILEGLKAHLPGLVPA